MRLPLTLLTTTWTIGVVVALVSLTGGTATAARTTPAITPAVYAQVASGVALIRTRDCRGHPLGQGTGFLVGGRVIMTARHVVVGACSIRVTLGNRSYMGGRWTAWYSDNDTVQTADLATFRLDRPAPGHVFSFARRTPAHGATIAIVGHPLGNPLSLHQGRMLRTERVNGVPTIIVWVASAEGASGSPLLDAKGDVVGILQRGFVQDDAGAVFGINLARWWGPGVVRDLCRVYPQGRIPGCQGGASPNCASSDRAYLDSIARPYDTYVTRWNAWVDQGGLPNESFRPTLNALFALWERDDIKRDQACSAGAKRASGLIRGSLPLLNQAQDELDQLAALPLSDPGRSGLEASLDSALTSLSDRLDRLEAELKALGFFK
jgi:hypothetical protein